MGPDLEFLGVTDDDFLVTTPSPEWFTQVPTVTRDGTLRFEIAMHAFGRVWLQVSLTAHNHALNLSRTNFQDFVFGAFMLCTPCAQIAMRSAST